MASITLVNTRFPGESRNRAGEQALSGALPFALGV